MNEKIKVFGLGGLDENGKNLYIVEINNEIYVLDCGLKYPDNKIPGVDALIPNFDYLKENKSKIKAYFISHFHDDKMGALPYIWRECPAPIVTAPFTARLLELYTKRLHLENNYTFDYVTEPGYKMIGKRQFHFAQMTHSAPFSLSCSILTDQGWIVYTSDYVVDFNPLPNEFRMSIKEIADLSSKEVFMLLSDSNNADKPGHASPNYSITNKVRDLFENSTGRIFAALYNQNMMNIYEMYVLAMKTNKTIVCADKRVEQQFLNLYNTYATKTTQKPRIDSIENLNRLRDKDVIVALIDDGANLYNQIISFCEVGINNKLIDFKPEDTFIFDCPSVAATEILATNAVEAVYKTGCQVMNFTRKDINSMHANEEDIRTILTFLRPKYYVPISGSFNKLMANAKIALSHGKQFTYSNIFVLDNGMVINVENGIAKVDYKNIIPTGSVMIDGTDIGNVGNNVIEERNRLANDGVVIMGVTVSSKTKEIIGGPDVQMRGFVFLKESENILRNITELFLDQVRVYLTGYKDDNQPYEDKIIERVQRYIRRETGKNPVIIPKIIDLDI
jgi:ribonuclease J